MRDDWPEGMDGADYLRLRASRQGKRFMVVGLSAVAIAFLVIACLFAAGFR